MFDVCLGSGIGVGLKEGGGGGEGVGVVVEVLVGILLGNLNFLGNFGYNMGGLGLNV